MPALPAAVLCAAAASATPPRRMPAELVDRYTMGGRVATAEMYIDDTDGGKGTHYRYPRADVDDFVAGAKKRREWYASVRDGLVARGALPPHPRGPAKRDWIFEAMRHAELGGARVAVYGAIEPWDAAVALAHGAAKVTVFEYNRLGFDHPSIATRTVADCAAAGAEGCGGFDVAMSMSSFDHDGLGRYGDPLDPDGDLRAMADARGALRPGGLLIVTVPVGPDVVVWNLHRRYGRARLPLLLEGWEEVARVGWDEAKLDAEASWRQSYEPVFILRKPAEGAAAAPAAAGGGGGAEL